MKASSRLKHYTILEMVYLKTQALSAVENLRGISMLNKERVNKLNVKLLYATVIRGGSGSAC